MSNDTPDTGFDNLSPSQIKFLKDLAKRLESDNAVETLIKDDNPYPKGFNPLLIDLIEKDYVTYGRGRCGPLGIYIGVYVLNLTENGKLWVKML